MGKFKADGPEKAVVLKTGSFIATGNSGWIAIAGPANIVLFGTFVASALIDVSFDGGTNFVTELGPDGVTPLTITKPDRLALSETEQGVLYRIRCSAFTSGEMFYRVSA